MYVYYSVSYKYWNSKCPQKSGMSIVVVVHCSYLNQKRILQDYIWIKPIKLKHMKNFKRHKKKNDTNPNKTAILTISTVKQYL